MSFKFLSLAAARRKAEWDAHVSPAVKARVKSGQPILLIEWRSMRLNSYERHELIPLLSNVALIWEVENCLKHCGGEERLPPVTYDDALIHVYAPLLVERLRKANEIIDSIPDGTLLD